MMKKTLTLLLAIAFSFSAFAQSKADGIKNYHYKKYESAIKILQPLSAKDAYANYHLGLSHLGLENTAKAKEVFQKHADDAANMAGLARIMFIEGKDAEAKAMLEKVTRKTSRRNKNAYLFAADAVTYTDGGDLNKALEWYDYYLEWKKSPTVLMRKGDAYLKMMNGGDAMTSYQNGAEQGGDLSISYYKQGNLWYRNKRYDSARANYERAAAADAKNPLPHYDLSYAYYKINKYKLARQAIEKYLELSDKSADDQMQYGNILYLSKDYDGAIKKMNELISSGVEKSYMYRVLGYSYHEKKDSANALKNMDLLFKKHPKKKLISQDYFTYGKILSGIEGRQGEAGKYYEQYIAADTSADKTVLYRDVADGYKDANDYANAAQWYKKIVESTSTEKEILDYWWAGYSFYRQRDYDNSNDMFTKLVAERPEEPIGHYWLGKVAAAQDPDYKNGKGVELFKKYVPMVEGNEDKKENLASAYTYLSVVAYNQKKYGDAKLYANKLLSVKPESKTAKQILAGIPK